MTNIPPIMNFFPGVTQLVWHDFSTCTCNFPLFAGKDGKYTFILNKSAQETSSGVKLWIKVAMTSDSQTLLEISMYRMERCPSP
jgi:hypothetical protein